MDDDERVERAADLKTAIVAGGGLGLSLLGLVIPFASLLGLTVSYLGWRSARREYRIGRVFAGLGMGIGVIGLSMLLLAIIAAGASGG